MDNINLFDDLDFDEPVKEVPKKEPVVKTKPESKAETKPAEMPTKEEITDAVKDVIEEIKPAMISSLDELFNSEPEKEEESDLDNEDYLKKTTTEKLSSTSEVEIDGIKIVIKEEGGLYALYKAAPESDGDEEETEDERIVKEPLTFEEAVKQGVDYILKVTQKDKKKSTSKKKSKAPTVAKKEEEPPYEGPRHVKVWGRELWTELDPKVTETQIVEKIARDFGLPEFREGKVMFDLDKVSGVLSVGLSFNKKG